MQNHILWFIVGLLCTPCVFLVVRLYKAQREEEDGQERLLQRIGIVWAILVFMIIVASSEYLWSTYIANS